DLRSSIPLCLHVYTPASRVQHTRPPSLHVAEPVACLQRSNASYCVPPSSRPRDAAPELLTASVSTHIQSAPRPPELRTSMPPCLHAGIAPPTLHACIPPCRYTCSMPPALRTSIPLKSPDPQRAS